MSVSRHTPRSRPLRLLGLALVLACAPKPAAGPAPRPAGLPPIPAASGPLRIDVVAPGENEALPTRDSTFVYGSVGTGGATLTIDGARVPVEPNGAFMAYLPVPAGGVYHLEATAAGQTARADRRVRVPGAAAIPSTGARILAGTATPRGAWTALPGERIDVGFRGTPGGVATLVLPDGRRIPLAESGAFDQPMEGAENFASDGQPAGAAVPGVSTYRGFFGAVPLLSADTVLGRTTLAPLPSPASFGRLGSADSAMERGAEAAGSVDALRAADASASADRARRPAPARGLRPGSAGRLQTAAIFELVVGPDTARTPLPLSLAVLPEGRPRVGAADEPAGADARGFVPARPGTSGPYHYLWPNSTKLALTGERAGLFRVTLGDGQDAWVERSLVRLLPVGAPPPFTRVNTVRLNPAPGWVDVRMVLGDRVPFFVTVPDERTLQIDLYGAVSNTNYLQYGPHDPLIRQAEWSQPADSIYRVTVRLTQPVWGYRTLWTEGGDLVLRIRRPPAIDPRAPFKGLKIALDPGHPPGGAVGPTRWTEAQANLAVALRLKPMLEREGATVLMSRTDMTAVPLNSRPLRAARENADIYLSLHNNGLPPGLNPYVNTGTSAYYFHPFSQPLAVDLQQALLRELGLKDLGVGRADFALVRTPWFPSVLTETMFLMVPQQEAALRNPDAQERIARAHVAGLRAFLLSRAREQGTVARR
ncbi:MAG TPA: N-acetylmuramoyl-L-alanine amidase [Longimicrobiales bacterium]|nr:N-acetylmuramoyl-L-alanine amidase [Longimicrobiales bacterium]